MQKKQRQNAFIVSRYEKKRRDNFTNCAIRTDISYQCLISEIPIRFCQSVTRSFRNTRIVRKDAHFPLTSARSYLCLTVRSLRCRRPGRFKDSDVAKRRGTTSGGRGGALKGAEPRGQGPPKQRTHLHFCAKCGRRRGKKNGFLLDSEQLFVLEHIETCSKERTNGLQSAHLASNTDKRKIGQFRRETTHVEGLREWPFLAGAMGREFLFSRDTDVF